MQRPVKVVFLLALLSLSVASAPAWNSAPWLADLDQIRLALDRDYPNRDWLTEQREVSLDRWFDSAAKSIRESRDDAEARRALDRLIERFDDGHVALRWPSPVALLPVGAPNVAPAPKASPAKFCVARGYDKAQVTPGTAASLPGYRAVDGEVPFRSGILRVGNRNIGVLRIGVFSPQGYPSLCEQVAARSRVGLDKPCDAACEDRLLTEVYALLTRSLIGTVERLRAAGAHVLLIDLTRNGGGTEWAEAAARIISPVTLRSAPIGVMRSEAWVSRWTALASKLRREAERASSDRVMLLDLATQADALADGSKPCTGTICPRLVSAGFSSGMIAELAASRLDGKPWAVDVFSASQFPYRDRVWTGPLIVLVDDETWSAAEQFTALLRDNDAAIVMGTRTGGAGCGRIYGGDPVTLTHSKAKLELPNCARFRKDGSNEVSGIVPDVATGVRWNDGPAYAGRLTLNRLPEALAQADSLVAHRRK